jgi:hypothetical protein
LHFVIGLDAEGFNHLRIVPHEHHGKATFRNKPPDDRQKENAVDELREFQGGKEL